MRRKEIEENLSAVANRLYRIGKNESAHHSTTTSTETVGEEIQRLSFLIDKCVAALKTKEGDSQQTTNTGSPKLPADCADCQLRFICKGPSMRNGLACRGARSQLRAGA